MSDIDPLLRSHTGSLTEAARRLQSISSAAGRVNTAFGALNTPQALDLTMSEATAATAAATTETLIPIAVQMFKAFSLVAGFGSMAYSGLSAAATADQLPRRRIAKVAGAHAFGYWLFEYRLAQNPGTIPASLSARHRSEDQRGVMDGVTAQQFANLWRRSVNDTTTQLTQTLNRVPIGRLRARLTDLQPNVNVTQMSAPDARAALKVFLGQGFLQQPGLAAKAHLLASLQSSHRAERVSTLALYRNYPYLAT